MIQSINQQNNHTNFKAVVPIKMVLVDNKLLTEQKEIKSALNGLVNILLKKKNKQETDNPAIRGLCDNIRTVFKSKVGDYFIPQGYTEAPREVGKIYGQNITILHNYTKGDHFILTRNEANLHDNASLQRKYANAKNKNPFLNGPSIEEAQRFYHQTLNKLLAKVNLNDPKLVIYAKREKSGKITPFSIDFTENHSQSSLF
ncbi:MAG: hypothetical protein WCF95_00350 [bacterium]